MRHEFKEFKCIYCNRLIEDLYYELLIAEVPEVLEINYVGVDSYGIRQIVIDFHTQCLTDDEMMIKDIIE